MNLSFDWRVVGAAAALIVAVVFAFQVRMNDAKDAWEAEADSIREASALAIGEFQRQSAVLDSLYVLSLQEGAEAQESREVAERRLRDIESVSVPPECDSVVAVRDTIYMEVIDTLRVSSDQYRAAWLIERERGDSLELTADELATQLAANVKLLDNRPKDRWYVPEVGAGIFAGLCTDGLPCSGVGATLSWELRF